MNAINCEVECRADSTGESPGRIVGTLIEQGRVSQRPVGREARAEVFAPGSIRWPREGMRLLAEHLGREVMTFTPVVDGPRIGIDAALPDTEIGREVAREVRSGAKTGLSIEFMASREAEVMGVREIRAALVDVAALAPPEATYYRQGRVEVRAKGAIKWPSL